MGRVSDVLRIAAGEIGYSRWTDPEQGSRYGRWYAQLTGNSLYGESGVPYCAMFASWVLSHAGVKCPGFPGAYTPTMAQAGINAGRRVLPERAAQPGDIVYFDWGGSESAGKVDHVGIVELNKGSYLQTIEGNTSSGASGSQGNGGVVARRTRSWGTVAVIVRPCYNDKSEVEDEVTDADIAKIAQAVAQYRWDGDASQRNIYDKLRYLEEGRTWDDTTHASPTGQLVADYPVTYGDGDQRSTASLAERVAYIDSHTHAADAKLDSLSAKVDELMGKLTNTLALLADK